MEVVVQRQLVHVGRGRRVVRREREEPETERVVSGCECAVPTGTLHAEGNRRAAK